MSTGTGDEYAALSEVAGAPFQFAGGLVERHERALFSSGVQISSDPSTSGDSA